MLLPVENLIHSVISPQATFPLSPPTYTVAYQIGILEGLG